MRTIWNGSISFGLVNIPVGLAVATQRQDVAFRTLHRECGTPIKQKRWCPLHEREVEPDELVKGWEFAEGQFVLWGKENLCLIRAKESALLMETLFFAEDVRAKTEIEEAVAETDVQKAELQLAEQVISSLAGEWKPEDFENDYRRDLAQMLEAKLAGQEIVAPEPVSEAPVIDLIEALRQSVADAQSRREAEQSSSDGKARAKAGSRSRKAPAKKSA